MLLVGLLVDTPNAAKSVGLLGQLEVSFREQVDHFVDWQEVAGIEFDAAGSLADQDLTNWESVNDAGLFL